MEKKSSFNSVSWFRVMSCFFKNSVSISVYMVGFSRMEQDCNSENLTVDLMIYGIYSTVQYIYSKPLFLSLTFYNPVHTITVKQ